jgi:hypothetical protein
MRPLRPLAFIGFLSVPAALFGQNLSLGLIGGGALTDAAQALGATPQTFGSTPHKDWIAGAVVEFRTASLLSFEIDGIYRQLSAMVTQVEPAGTPNHVYPENVVTWEFPILAKYRFGEGNWRPFMEGGPELRATGNLNFSPSHVGVAAGIGVETRWRGFTIAPVLRYTRWGPDHGQAFFTSLQNQVELLLAVSRSPESDRRPFGQRFSFGAIAGWGLTADLPSSSPFASTGAYIGLTGSSIVTSTGLTSPIAGAAFDIALPRRFSAEIDAFYKPMRGQSVTEFQGQASPAAQTYGRTSFQFPVLAKYRFRRAGINPFLEAGPSFRRPDYYGLSKFGATAGAGVEFRWRAARIAPALRFTRWDASDWWESFPRNEADAVVTVLFGGATL